MKNSLSVFTICLLLGFVLANAFGSTNTTKEETKQQKTFMDCYSENAALFFVTGMFSPYTIDLTDPQMKKLITNLCNFYYEKSGQWISFRGDKEIYEKYRGEFWQQYPINELPKGLKELWVDQQQKQQQ